MCWRFAPDLFGPPDGLEDLAHREVVVYWLVQLLVKGTFGLMNLVHRTSLVLGR
jgi:hypothetical protein